MYTLGDIQNAVLDLRLALNGDYALRKELFERGVLTEPPIELVGELLRLIENKQINKGNKHG